MSPFVLIDDFKMTGKTFDLHPHAGMSAVTLTMLTSKGHMHSLDSINNCHTISPGDLHWTLAGSGIIHTQKPVEADACIDAFQLFVNLPEAKKKLYPLLF